ncbi:hypothetical protein X975_06616, partial [Stegodyphus mimosarum]
MFNCWTPLNQEAFCGLFFLFLTVFPQGNFCSDGTLFTCSFRIDTCGMQNQLVTEAKWHRRYLIIGDRAGYAMVVKSKEAYNHFARFLTPYIQTQGAYKGCLRFHYFIDGRTPASLAVIKQGAVTKYIFATAYKTRDHWKYAEIDVDFLDDEVMFYFEADTKVQEFGDSIVAFTDLQITDHPCHQLH